MAISHGIVQSLQIFPTSLFMARTPSAPQASQALRSIAEKFLAYSCNFIHMFLRYARFFEESHVSFASTALPLALLQAPQALQALRSIAWNFLTYSCNFIYMFLRYAWFFEESHVSFASTSALPLALLQAPQPLQALRSIAWNFLTYSCNFIYMFLRYAWFFEESHVSFASTSALPLALLQAPQALQALRSIAWNFLTYSCNFIYIFLRNARFFEE
jgi:hypothetical protein